ncbi:hypothetical protein Tco_0074879, partial [Tanacetum coccineum]
MPEHLKRIQKAVFIKVIELGLSGGGYLRDYVRIIAGTHDG